MVDHAWLLRGGRLIDPANGIDQVTDLVVRDGRIASVGHNLTALGAKVVDLAGCLVMPGLIDVHVHLREPGQAWKETLRTGSAAAAAGGFTTIFCMPNTEPALDNVAIVKELRGRIEREARVRVRMIGAITQGRAGREAVDFAALVAAGVVGFSDDGVSTADSGIMRRALTASRELGRPIMVHSEDAGLAHGAMHEGIVSAKLGIAGIPAAAEEIIIARDLALAELTGGWLHLCHVSTEGGADLIARAKADGVTVTAEVMPHHLVMDDDWVAGDRTLRNVGEPPGERAAAGDPNTKVNPPLRTLADTRALLVALQTGVIDLVATDHAPHAAAEKLGRSFGEAAFGLSGLEFALPLMLSLVRAGHLTLTQLVNLMSAEPARLWKLEAGSLAVGMPADLVVVDPERRWRVEEGRLRTKSANTPLLGMMLRGQATLVLVGGEERSVG